MGGHGAALMALGAFLVLVSAVPYMLTIVGGRTRPRVFSWIVWTLLGGIATVAAYTEGEYASAALTAAATVETGSIVVLGWKYGDRRFERLDAGCLVGVTVGLGLWVAFRSPLMGLVAAVAIDVIAAIPTVRHAWRKPHEEAAVAYALCAVAALCFIAAMPQYTLMGLLYPTYSLAINTAIAGIIWRVARPATPYGLVRPSRRRGGAPVRGFRRSRRLAPPAEALSYGRHAASAPLSQERVAAPTRTHGRHAAGVVVGREQVPAPGPAPDDIGPCGDGRRSSSAAPSAA